MILEVELPEEMPQGLIALIARFMETNPLLAFPDHAYGRCGDTSGEFKDMLQDHCYPGTCDYVDWEFWEDVDGTWYAINGPTLPPYVWEIYLGNLGASHQEFCAHLIVCVDKRWFIDFTARQFDPLSPWPLVWDSARWAG